MKLPSAGSGEFNPITSPLYPSPEGEGMGMRSFDQIITGSVPIPSSF